MSRLGVAHIVFGFVAMVVFIGMAIMSIPFQQTAQWFPLYVAILGAAVSLATVIVATVSVVRKRRASLVPAPTAGIHTTALAQVETALPTAVEDDGDEKHVTAKGFAWLGTWVAFVVLALLIGYIPASALWIGVWFRTVHKWRWVIVIPLVVVITVLLILADLYLNIRMPGPSWVHDLFQ